MCFSSLGDDDLDDKWLLPNQDWNKKNTSLTKRDYYYSSRCKKKFWHVKFIIKYNSQIILIINFIIRKFISIQFYIVHSRQIFMLFARELEFYNHAHHKVEFYEKILSFKCWYEYTTIFVSPRAVASVCRCSMCIYLHTRRRRRSECTMERRVWVYPAIVGTRLVSSLEPRSPGDQSLSVLPLGLLSLQLILSLTLSLACNLHTRAPRRVMRATRGKQHHHVWQRAEKAG